MFKRLKAIKELLWAAGIGIALILLFIGFIAISFTPYYGDRGFPAMDLRSGKSAKDAAQVVEAEQEKTGMVIDGMLHPLPATDDAGQEYLDSITYLLDSAFINLRGSGLTNGQVWSSETGTLMIVGADSWTIRYPGDGSFISPASAAMIAKPKLMVLGLGNDLLSDVGKEQFVESYKGLIQSLLSASPDTVIICMSPASVNPAYSGSDGMNKERVGEIDSWIKTVCMETGAYYADLTGAIWNDGYLRSEYSDGSGRSLNSAGLREVLNYLRDHSLDVG